MPASTIFARCTDGTLNPQGIPIYDVDWTEEDIWPGYENVLLIGKYTPPTAGAPFDWIPCQNELSITFVNGSNNQGVAVCVPETVRESFNSRNITTVCMISLLVSMYGIYRTIKSAVSYSKESE